MIHTPNSASSRFVRQPINYSPNPNMSVMPNQYQFVRNQPMQSVQPVQPMQPYASGSNPVQTNTTPSYWLNNNSNGINYHNIEQAGKLHIGRPDPNFGRTVTQGIFGEKVTFDRAANWDELLNQNENYKGLFQAQPLETQEYIKNHFFKTGNLIGSGSNAYDGQQQINGFMANQKNNSWTPQNTISAIQSGAAVLNSLIGAYSSYKNYKLAKEQSRENQAMQRAQYKIQAKGMNAAYRDRASGRGFAVMGTSHKRPLVDYVKRNRIEESY